MIIEPTHWFWESEIPPSVCNVIISEGLRGGIAAAVVDTDNPKVNEDIRLSRTAFLEPSKHAWLSAIAWHYMSQANKQAWNFAITGQEVPQFTVYDVDDFYDYHQDSSRHKDGMRKLSLVITLNDDYGGGDFQFEGYKREEQPLIKPRGSVMVFPSALRHRVAPVTFGTRYSLVNWFTGPKFV